MSKPQSYKELEIYQFARKLAIDVYKISSTNVPWFEMYEEGIQISRSSKSIVYNIIKGFSRKRYKNEFIQFLTYAFASCEATKGHLERLYKTRSFSKTLVHYLYTNYEKLGGKIYNFRQALIEKHDICDESQSYKFVTQVQSSGVQGYRAMNIDQYEDKQNNREP